MTREEARDILFGCIEAHSEEENEALDMAIEALEREGHDGCDGCRYEANHELSLPCVGCKQNYVDKYVPMPEHDREWIIGCIKHDGFVKTDRGDKANQIILDALSADNTSTNTSTKSTNISTDTSADRPRSEQYKKGFEDAKRAFLVEYARESENMRKRNAELEVMLNAQKAISADRPRGEWTEVGSFESEKHSVTDMRCSICGKYASMVLPHGTTCVYDFCPNCGADMRGEKNNGSR